MRAKLPVHTSHFTAYTAEGPVYKRFCENAIDPFYRAPYRAYGKAAERNAPARTPALAADTVKSDTCLATMAFSAAVTAAAAYCSDSVLGGDEGCNGEVGCSGEVGSDAISKASKAMFSLAAVPAGRNPSRENCSRTRRKSTTEKISCSSSLWSVLSMTFSFKSALISQTRRSVSISKRRADGGPQRRTANLWQTGTRAARNGKMCGMHAGFFRPSLTSQPLPLFKLPMSSVDRVEHLRLGRKSRGRLREAEGLERTAIASTSGALTSPAPCPCRIA